MEPKSKQKNVAEQVTSSHREQRLIVPLPCPFCGSKPILEWLESYSGYRSRRIRCAKKSCHARPWVSVEQRKIKAADCREQALARWNHRHNAKLIHGEPDGSNKLAASSPSDGASCSASFAAWTKKRGVWPRLTHEEIYKTAWNNAIKAADTVAWEKRDRWDEGDGYSPTKAAAAEEIGYAIRRLSEPNATFSPGNGDLPAD